MVIFDLFSYIAIHFTLVARYNTVWIANTEIGLDPNNSVIKRLWCINSCSNFDRKTNKGSTVMFASHSFDLCFHPMELIIPPANVV